MKRILYIALVASLLVPGCTNKKRSVDEKVETDRYTLLIQGVDAWSDATGKDYGDIKWYSYKSVDTTVIFNTVPQMAYFLAMHHGIDNTTMFYIDEDKQIILPKYFFTIVDRDTTKPLDYMPLLQALIDRGILRTDTTYEPMRQLVVFDSARLEHLRKTEVLDDNPTYTDILTILGQLQLFYRMPVAPAPGVELYTMFENYTLGDKDWKADSLWLDKHGLRVVPDPQGRQMRIIEFNRCKGSI